MWVWTAIAALAAASEPMSGVSAAHAAADDHVEQSPLTALALRRPCPAAGGSTDPRMLAAAADFCVVWEAWLERDPLKDDAAPLYPEATAAQSRAIAVYASVAGDPAAQPAARDDARYFGAVMGFFDGNYFQVDALRAYVQQSDGGRWQADALLWLGDFYADRCGGSPPLPAAVLPQ